MPKSFVRFASVLLVAGWTAAAMATDDAPPMLDVAGGTTIEPHERMVAAASRLLESVSGEPTLSEVLSDYSMRDMLLHEAGSDEIENWSYWPTDRIGLPLKLMTTDQMVQTQELLWSLLSEQGYLKILNIMQLENLVFWTTNSGFPRGMGDYTLVFFGEPSMTEPWSWRFEGHHISLNVSVAPDGVAVTPSFVGAKPSRIAASPLTGVRLLRTWEDAAKTLINSMTEQQRSIANVAGDPDFNTLAASLGIVTFDDAPFDPIGTHFLRPESDWENWRDLPADGIAGSALNPKQKALLARLVDSVKAIYRPQHLTRYPTDTDDLRFAFMGSSTPEGMIYFRIQGGDFFYEYGNTQAEPDHVHTVWRDKSHDHGADLLLRHLQQRHQKGGLPAD